MTRSAMSNAGRIDVDGVKIAFRIEGEGPPLVLIMGYRLSAAAWPLAFIASLKRHFTVVTLDNRGTGQSDKPLTNYALANMARDVAAVLDGLDIATASVLGYSMGGAIAQEFVRQFPDRVSGLVLCATMCGGRIATYAEPRVIKVMRDLDGLSTQDIARRIWQVTYAPVYLKEHSDLAENQMLRETALPTPLHAADLQFQAFAQFDGSRALAGIRCPTLVLTGDLDRLVPPQNSTVLAKLIPDAQLEVIIGGGHRVLWEATEDCAAIITNFLTAIGSDRPSATRSAFDQGHAAPSLRPVSSFVEWFSILPLMTAQSVSAALSLWPQSIPTDQFSPFGDGKPIVILGVRLIGSELMLKPMAEWLKALGYRPTVTGATVNANDTSGEISASQAIRAAAQRVGRKTVVMAHSVDMARALRIVRLSQPWVSDLIVFDATAVPDAGDVRTHVMASLWPAVPATIALPHLLAKIPIELIDEPRPGPSSEPAETGVA